MEFQSMCEGDTDGIPENTRLILQLAYARNETLASYIRLTDVAIWGFLAFTATNVFKTGYKFVSVEVFLFLFLFIISMIMWRCIVCIYQKDIEKGYVQILKCEHLLDIPYTISLRRKFLITKFPELINILDKTKQCTKLIEKFEKNVYYDEMHRLWNVLAGIFGGIAALTLVFQYYCFLNPVMCII